MPPLRAALAEFVGTFALMFVGGGAMILVEAVPDIGGLVTIALAHGLILAVMVSATLHISGGQFNPAVSIALVTIGRQRMQDALIFIVAQIIAVVAAAVCLQAFLGSLDSLNGTEKAVETARLGATLGGMNLGAGAVFGLEIIATFFLMFVIMGSAVDDRGVGNNATVGGFAIGLCVAALILCFGPLTGASMNPARSFGPALVGGYWSMHWLYWIAPLIGAVLAANVYRHVFGASPSDGMYEKLAREQS